MKPFFSKQEIRAVVLLLPIVGLFVAVVVLMRPKADPHAASVMQAQMESRADSAQLRPFDPNTADFRELLALGLTKHEAASLLRYRAAGKVFRIPEDVATCYGISDSLYLQLEPYIRIHRRFATVPSEYRGRGRVARPVLLEPFRMDTVSAAYLVATGLFSHKQARVLINWRNRTGCENMQQLAECYVVGDSLAAVMEPYVIFPDPKLEAQWQPVELNTADSAALRGVYGIGERTVGTIMRYRERLGGFVRVEQLSEVPGVTEQNYERILKQIYCDSCKIKKIDVNFATPNQLGEHPYFAPRTLRKLLKARQLKGGWSTAQEMIDDHILTLEEAARLAPYLSFGVRSGIDK